MHQDKINRHPHSYRGQHQGQQHGRPRHLPGHPGSASQLLNQANVTHHCTHVHQNAQTHQSDSRPHRQPCRMCRHVRLPRTELPQKKSKSAHGKPDSHQAKPRPNPGEKRPFRGKINSWVLLSTSVHTRLYPPYPVNSHGVMNHPNSVPPLGRISSSNNMQRYPRSHATTPDSNAILTFGLLTATSC